ncbi:MAG: chitobiase/beta-hexosaminidase C-terminal domain-containing protein, partial [Phycisphaerae bacterium]|nr:chitobiase/beta-hexosaminidase C-terminal domain-containing protein [Phycisphaerae bacterium]
CPTDGASIAYTTDDGPGARWRLCTGRVRINETTTIRAKACRLGYKDSAEVKATFTIAPEKTEK